MDQKLEKTYHEKFASVQQLALERQQLPECHTSVLEVSGIWRVQRLAKVWRSSRRQHGSW
eukprot:2409165-Amphidinium_carterae.1